MSNLLTKLSGWRPFQAVVVGDFMLDQTVYGDAERLSPDAPVPVLRVRRTENNPGGAASVCLDLVALRGRVRAFGVTGADPEGESLRARLEESGVDVSGFVADPSRPTTVKRSLVGLAQHRHPQKMFRLDMESRDPLSGAHVDEILARFEAALPGTDVVCLEDYNKGVCSPRLCAGVIERCRAAGVPVIVDPALIEDYSRYRGATAITPNRTEAELATGEDPGGDPDSDAPERIARSISDAFDIEAVVVTLDRHGAFLLQRSASGDSAAERIPTVARQVYDVTGAGDMVIAALGAAIANGVDWPDAVRFANAAAGLEVEVFGVQPIPLERIHAALLIDARKLIGKRRSLDETLVEVAAHRREGRTVVFTNGCFDVIHAGHIALLKEAAKFGDVLVVGINSDESVSRLKGPERPVHGEDDRVAVLSELESVDIVTVFADDTPVALLEALRPDVLVKGGDYARDQVVGGDLVESWGGRIELVTLLEGRSSTSSIERIRAAAPDMP